MDQRTLVQLFEKSVDKFRDNVLMWEKQDDSFVGTTYAELRPLVHQFAAGLIYLGIERGDRAALISEGRNMWVVAELGILYSGAINVPLSIKIDELPELKFRLSHSGCKFAVVSGSQLDKVSEIVKDLPDLQKVIVLDPVENLDHEFITLQNLLEKGKNYLQENSDSFEARWKSVEEDDPANICYTSGTTADPKGIVLTHRNYTANVEQASAILNVPPEYCSLLILPWDHSFAHTAGIYTLMQNGASMASVQTGKTPLETLKNIPVNIKEIRPTFLLSVPALAQNFRKNIEKGIRLKGPKVEKLFNKALKVAYKYNGIGWNRGKGWRIFYLPLYKLYDKILFTKVREGFGGRLKFFIGGGALLDIELQRFFYAIGLPMLQGYGLTEAAPIISANVPERHKLGSSGAIMPNLDIKICDENGNELATGEKGEIVVKGENVMAGYWRNEKATAETVREDWLFTGDIGYLDSDRFLYVLGREKSLLISNDGEKFSPEGIEEAIVANCDFIDQMMLYNNQSAYTVALIVPNRELLLKWCKDNGYSCHSEEGQKAVLSLFEAEINKYRENGIYEGMFPTKWLPAAVAVLGEGFTEKNRFLNSTLKMVRSRIAEHYKARIDYLYTAEGKSIINTKNFTIIDRMDE